MHLTTDRLAMELRSELPPASADGRVEAAIRLGPNSGEEEGNAGQSGARWTVEETSGGSDNGGRQKRSRVITTMGSFL